MALSRVLARPMLASMFLVGGVNAMKNAPKLAGAAAPVTDAVVPALKKMMPQLPIPEDTVTLVRINAAVQIAAGLGLASGRAPRTSSAILAASLVPTTAAGHSFWTAQDPSERANQRIHFFKNVSLIGGLLISAGDTAGKPGVAWRTRHAATSARKEAKSLATSARREVKLAKATLT